VHNTYLSGTPSLWELRENAQTRFGTEHLLPNLQHAAKYFFDYRTGLTNSLWLSSAGLAALVYVVFRLWRARSRWRTMTGPHLVTVVFGAAIVGNLAILMFYYWGQLDDPIVARLALPVSAVLAVAIGYVVSQLSLGVASAKTASVPVPPKPWPVWIAVGGAVLAYLWSGVIANEQHNRRNTLVDEFAWETRLIEAMSPGERLIVSNKSGLPWMLRRIPSISIERARRNVDRLRRQVGGDTFREILVTQGYRASSADGDFQLNPADRLPDWFVLETIAERRFGAHVDRISRLVAIKPQEGPAEPSGKRPHGGEIHDPGK
jgi:hypothetical protein